MAPSIDTPYLSTNDVYAKFGGFDCMSRCAAHVHDGDTYSSTQAAEVICR